MSGRLTASCYGRARACPASIALPQAPQPSSRDSTRGTGIHKFLQRALTDGDSKRALSEIPEASTWRETCESLDTNIFRRSAERIECEAAFAYDPRSASARLLGYDLGRNYQLRAGEIPGAADLIVTFTDGSVLLVDWKCGHKTITTAMSDQLQLLALMVTKARALHTIRIAIVRIRDDGTTNVREGEDDYFDEAEDDVASAEPPAIWGEMTLGERDLARIELETSLTVARIADASRQITRGFAPDAAPGPHCQYCPALPSCPVYTKLARHMLQPANVDELLESLTPEAAGLLWERVARQEQILKLIKSGLQTYAARQPLPLADGQHVVAPQLVPRDSIDGDEGARLIKEALGRDAAHSITRPTITKRSIEQYAKRRTTSPAEARSLKTHILEVLRAGGAITTTHSTQFKVRERLPSDFLPHEGLEAEDDHANQATREPQPSLFTAPATPESAYAEAL